MKYMYKHIKTYLNVHARCFTGGVLFWIHAKYAK